MATGNNNPQLGTSAGKLEKSLLAAVAGGVIYGAILYGQHNNMLPDMPQVYYDTAKILSLASVGIGLAMSGIYGIGTLINRNN